jgi:hypothetical protein
MLLAHAALLSEARSYIAALADNAKTLEASLAYDLALIELDLVHVTTRSRSTPRAPRWTATS